jgi:hypothetical protein
MSLSPEFDFCLVTDGSGHQDGYGGWSSLAIGMQSFLGKTRVCMAGCRGTTVERAEFSALLLGLQSILEAAGLDNRSGLDPLERCPLRVLWISDRESLVLSVTRRPDGSTVYRRKASPDLWAHFEWYEKYFAITPRFSKRETNLYHNVVDRLASDARVLIKDYMELPDNSIERLMSLAS